MEFVGEDVLCGQIQNMLEMASTHCHQDDATNHDIRSRSLPNRNGLSILHARVFRGLLPQLLVQTQQEGQDKGAQFGQETPESPFAVNGGGCLKGPITVIVGHTQCRFRVDTEQLEQDRREGPRYHAQACRDGKGVGPGHVLFLLEFGRRPQPERGVHDECRQGPVGCHFLNQISFARQVEYHGGGTRSRRRRSSSACTTTTPQRVKYYRRQGSIHDDMEWIGKGQQHCLSDDRL